MWYFWFFEILSVYGCLTWKEQEFIKTFINGCCHPGLWWGFSHSAPFSSLSASYCWLQEGKYSIKFFIDLHVGFTSSVDPGKYVYKEGWSGFTTPSVQLKRGLWTPLPSFYGLKNDIWELIAALTRSPHQDFFILYFLIYNFLDGGGGGGGGPTVPPSWSTLMYVFCSTSFISLITNMLIIWHNKAIHSL